MHYIMCRKPHMDEYGSQHWHQYATAAYAKQACHKADKSAQ